MANKTEDLKEILKILDKQGTYTTREEVGKTYKKLLEIFKGLRPEMRRYIDAQMKGSREDVQKKTNSAYKEILATMQSIESSIRKSLETDRKITKKSLENMREEVRRNLDHFGDLVLELPRSEDIDEFFQKNKGTEQTAELIRDQLQSLEGEERLDASAIRGLQEALEEVRGDRYYGANRGVDVFVDGTNYGLTQYLNLLPGSGVTMTVNRVGERLDVTISVTGGGGSVEPLPATGTVDDSNTTFTFATEPSIVVVNGASYRDGHGCTITGTSVELDYPVGTGGDIYGIA